jgi:hypothetical protein
MRLLVTEQNIELRQRETNWNVDGDLFGLDPEHLVPDTFASFDSFFDTPNSSGMKNVF